MLGLIICSVFFIGGVNGAGARLYFTPATELGGNLIDSGNPLPVTLSLKLDSNQQGTVWILGLIEGKYLKMVKVRVTSESTYTWIATRYAEGYDSGCAIPETFSETCFESTKNTKASSDIYPVKLRFSKIPAARLYFTPATELGYYRTRNTQVYGKTLPVTLSLKLDSKLDSTQHGAVWILGLIEGKKLKMVKVRVYSESTYTWIATRYAEGYDSGCAIQSTFSETCFESAKNTKATSDIYPVKLRFTKFPGGAAFTKVFTGECDDGKEIRMYEGNGDNPGTAQQQAERCSLACVTGKKPLAGSWVDFVARGFTVQKGTGRCYCESENSFTCKRSTKFRYDRYDWGVGYKKVFTGECSEGEELLMYANGAQNPGKTAREREYECSKACRSKQEPQSDGFSAKGFIVKPEEGRCFCEADDSSKCDKQDHNEGYNRYDWESSVVPGFTKVFSGECTDGKEIRMYDGGASGDNPGTPEQQASRCSEACATMKEPKEGSWADFYPKGFIVSTNGRCWCESADSFKCTIDKKWSFGINFIYDWKCSYCPRETGNGYDRYDWHARKDCPSGYQQRMPICADVNECISGKIGNAGNGFGCSQWRECINTEGGAKCGDCSANFWIHDGDKLCKNFDGDDWWWWSNNFMQDSNDNSVKMSFSPSVGGLAAGVATVAVVSLLV